MSLAIVRHRRGAFVVCSIGLTVACCLTPAIARAQADRRRVLQTPGLVLETAAPTAQTFALTFTGDGRNLVAAGADKVVRVWPIQDGQLDREKLQSLRWATWRERRGSIYALGLSASQQDRYVAVGGYGLRTGSLAVLDRNTGRVTQGLLEPDQTWAVLAIAISPGGGEAAYGTYDGSVWVWSFEKAKPRLVGRHAGEAPNQVRLVTYLDRERVLSIARDGTALEWRLTEASPKPKERFRVDSRIDQVAMSGDQKWFAVAAEGTAESNRIELCALNGATKTTPLPNGLHARMLALDQTGSRLVVAVEGNPVAMHKPTGFRLGVLDLKQNKFSPLLERELIYDVQALAVHPSGNYLAVAGDQEIRIVDLRDSRTTDRLRGIGSELWSVGLSQDGRLLGFRDQRNPDPADWNSAGTGRWKVFDLRERRWSARQGAFEPVQPLNSSRGWSVEADRVDRYVWYAVSPGGKRYALPLDRDRDGFPRCYSFLEPSENKPVRLAVGHRWGVSIFDLRDGEVRRSRLFVGHQDIVTSVAPSADQKILVTASRDQTVAGWSLADWPNQGELGADFSLREGKLMVEHVAAGSPAWEAGLNPDDELTMLAFEAKPVPGGPATWLERLQQPVPGVEFFFRIRRDGEAKPVEMLTTVRQRPLWQFFPTRNAEWVLWRWRDYYYDTSTNGDFYIGWQVNGDVDETPQFHRAEQFRERFHRPEKVDDVLTKMVGDPDRVAVPEILPPKVELTAVSRDKDDIQFAVKVEPQASSFVAEPREISLWINDYKFRKWEGFALPFDETVTIPRELLRRGTNEFIAQSYNHGGARGDSKRVRVVTRAPEQPPRLYGLCIGISDYSRAASATDGSRVWDNLFFAADDARAISQIWNQQPEGRLYASKQVELLVEQQASRSSILEALAAISRVVKPDDRFVLFLAGHGYAQRDRPNVYLPRTFAFVCPAFDLEKPTSTGIGATALHDALATIPCRKMLLLDCCHSGSMDVIRELAPDGVGPLIMVACDSKENSYDIPFLGHGAFTNAILEAVGDKFSQADKDENSVLDSQELFGYVSGRVPRTIDLARAIVGAEASQTPQRFPLEDQTPAPFIQHDP